MEQKTLFSKKSKRGYKRLFLTCLRQMSNKRIQTSIIHIAPWSQKKILHEMHLICKMFYFCFHGNHSHNLRLKVYLVVSLVISYLKKIISVNTF
jgi:hypothetical protein